MQDDLSVSQAAKLLGVFPSTIVRWINADLFPGAYKLNPSATNSPYRIPLADIESFQTRRKSQIQILQDA